MKSAMDRTTNVLRKGARAAKCLTLLKLATSRIKVVRNSRSMSAKKMRGEIAQLIKSGQDADVYRTKADALIKQENMVAAYDLLDQYCRAIMSGFATIELQRRCPTDMKEPIATIIYAAPRCVELTELPAIKDAFVAKYGKEFAAAASELRSGCGVNTQIIELLSTQPATGDKKLKLMKEICKEHNVDWTPGEALAGPAAAAGHSEVKVERIQATGSTKANAVGVGEAGPSKIAPMPEASKHGASNKIGLAEAMVSTKAGGDVLFATNASKTSDQKQSSSSEGDVTKGKPSVPERFKGVTSTAPATKDASKAAVFAADASKVDDTKLSAFEEEDARRLRERILQSLRGGSFVDLDVEAEANAKDFEKPADADAQGVTSDSDNESFVSVEEGKFEDDVEPFSDGAASRKESFRDNPNQGFSEAELKRPSLSQKLSTGPHQDINARTSSKNSGEAMEIHEGMLANSNFSIFPSKISHENSSFKANSMKSLNTEAALEKEKSKDGLNIGKLVEAHSVEELKKKKMINERKDNSLRVSSKESLIVEEMMEEESITDSLNMGKLIEVQSAEDLNDNRKMNEKVAEELSIETSEQESLQRKYSLEEKSVEATTSSGKDSLEKKSAEVTKEDSVIWKSSERYSLKARKTVEGLGDERCLHSEGIIEVMPSVATADFKIMRNHAEGCSFDANEVEAVAEENPRLPSLEMFKNQSGSEAVSEEACLSTSEFPEGVCNDASRVFGKEPSPSFEKALGTGGGELGSLPAVGKNAEELVGVSSLSAFATRENSQDFTAIAQAIAAEAARLAVRDYAKRLAESSSVPLDLGDLCELSKLGIAFEENKGGPQVRKASKVEGSTEYTDSEGLGHPGDKKSYETDSIKEEKFFKAETTLNCDKVCNSDHLNANEMNANDEKSNFSVTDDPLDGDSGNLNASTDTENISKLQETATEIEDINPFAANVATNTDKDTDYSLSKLANEEPSWVDMTPYGQTSKVGDFGNSDHLDVFFRRKAPMMYEENPMFDEERDDYLKFKPNFMDGRMHYGGSDTKKSSLQGNIFSRPLFDTPTEGESTVMKEDSDFLEGPVFDEGDGGLFKSPVFDEGPEPYDCAFSSDDGLENSSSAVADKGGSRSPINISSPASFDLEPEPCFAKVGDEERKESPPKGQLKWQSKKPSNAVTGNESDTPLGVSGNLMSRRSRRQPQDYDGSKHHGDHTGQFTSRSNLLQYQGNKPDRKDEDKVVEKMTPGRGQVHPYVSGSSAMSQWPLDPPKWGSGQSDYESPLEDEWGSTSTKIVSTRTTKSPARFDDKQRVRPEDFYFPEKDDLTRFDNRQRAKPEDLYFPEKDDLTRNSASTGVSKKTHESPTRMTQQQLMTPVYVGVEEDPTGYKISHSIPRMPKVYEHGMIDNHTEELQGKYNPSSQTGEQSKRASAGSGFDSEQQQYHRQQTPGIRSEYKHYSKDGGESSRIRSVPSRQQPKKYMEEEPSRYKPVIQDDEPLDHGSSNRSRIPKLSQLEKDVDEDTKQQHHQQEEPDVESKDVGERLRTRPMSNRQKDKNYVDVEKPFLVSRYEPTMQDDEFLNTGSINKSRTSKLNQVGEDLEGKEQMRSEYRQSREDPGESLRTRPMSSRLQPKKKFIEEESYLVSQYMTGSQDGQSLDDGSSNNSRIPKLHQFEKDVDEGHEGLQGGDSFQTQRDGSGKRASGSSGVDMWYQQHRQQEEEAFESGDVHYEEHTAGRDRILASQLSAGRKPSDLEVVQDLASGYKPLNQWDNQVKSAPLARPLPSRHQEKKYVETTLRYNTPITTHDRMLGRQKEEELFIPQISSQQKQGPQQKQNWQTSSEVSERESQSKRQNPASLQQYEIQKNKQQSVSGHWQKQSMAEEEDVERQHFQSPSYKNHQKEKKDLHSFDETCELQQENQMPKSTSSLGGQQDQVGKPSKSPLYSRKQDSRLGDNSSNSDQEDLEPEVRGASSCKERHSQEGGINEQQEKALNETQPLSRPHKSRTEEEGGSGKEDKSGTKSQLFEQLSQSTSLPLDSSISDPIVLATIPPPVKKPLRPLAVKLESSSSAPSPSKPPEVKEVPKVPQRPPNLEDLAANFEAFRKARKGE